jgi:hypothetical protein
MSALPLNTAWGPCSVQRLAEKEAQQAASQFPCEGASRHLFYNLEQKVSKRDWQQRDTCEQMCCTQAVCNGDLPEPVPNTRHSAIVAPVAKNSKVQSKWNS